MGAEQQSIVIGTAGHIDHGKSTLVLALTGTDPDRLKEEKARGITIDLGFAHLEHKGVNFAFVDVPGHERFVRNMLAGAGGIDVVMLVVAADESVMPQTREHFAICSLLRVSAGVVALTKADLVDEDTLELCRLEIRELVDGSFLENAPVVAVSAKTGDGMDALRDELLNVASRTRGRPAGGVLRLPIDRAFSMRGFGTVVTGTMMSGMVHPEDVLSVLPSAHTVKVRGLQVHGRAAEAARAGQRTAINVSGVDVAEVARGDVLCTPGAFEPTGRVDVSIEMLADVRPLKHGSRVRFHQGTSEVLGRVALSADPQYARIRLERAAVLTRGDRFILRAYSPPVTIGGGTVLDPRPPRGALRTSAAQERFARLNPLADPRAVSRAFIDERGIHGLPVSAFVSRVGLSPDAATAVINELHADGQVARVGELVVSSAALQERASALLEAVKRHHAAQPLSAGLPREEARERLFGRAAPAVFEHVLATLERESRLSARETLALPGHTMALSPEESRARDALLSTFKAAGLGPPEAKGAASAAGLDAAVSDRVLKLLVREKKLVRLDQLVFHADSLAQLKADLHARKAAGESRLDVSVFKERYGITRKYAIPLLEYLDRERVTRRVGDAREIL